MPAIFSHTGQIHEEMKRFLLKRADKATAHSEGEAKKSGANEMVVQMHLRGDIQDSHKKHIFSPQRISI